MIERIGKARPALSVLLAAALSLFSMAALPHRAEAVPDGLSISDAQQAVKQSKYTLAEAESKLASLSDECTQLEDEIGEMQTKVDELAQQTMDAQQAMFAGRESLGDAMVYEYRNNSVSALLGVMFGSNDWSQFTKGVDYISSIMDSQAEEVEKQKHLKAELEEVSGELSKQKDEQESKLSELESKRVEAQQVVDQVTDEVEANTERLEELKAQAARIAQAEKATETETGTEQPKKGTSTTAPSSPTTIGSEWRQGVASAYGGSSDPNTPNPGTTATGAVCDDNSMGVAIPTSMANYRSYFGKTVEIQYGGKTVYAVVNDCGGMGHGSRALDLQPGVFKALGYKDCRSWGVRTVTYRFY